MPDGTISITFRFSPVLVKGLEARLHAAAVLIHLGEEVATLLPARESVCD